MSKNNYQKELESLLEPHRGERLLLHVCCAPCATYVLKYLSEYFKVTAFFYNPNIYPEEEYQKRNQTLKELLGKMPGGEKISLIEGEYEPNCFYSAVKGLEGEPEGGKRCEACIKERMQKTAELAKQEGYDWFCTTLSISPHKNATFINEEGSRLAEAYGVPFLPSDFKKKNGFLASILLSKEYELYRQNDCGCVFSKREERN